MPTKSFLFPALFFTLLSGCVPHSKFASPSAVTIRLYARQNGKMNKSFKVISLTDKAALSKVPTLLSSSSAKLYKCGYKGEVTLTNREGKSLSFEYNTTGNCSYGTYIAKASSILTNSPARAQRT